MELEFNKIVIDNFKEKTADIDAKIESIKKYLDYIEDAEEIENVNEILTALEKASKSLGKEISSMERKNSKGISILKYSTKTKASIIDESEYKEEFEKLEEESKKTDEQISTVESMSNAIQTDNFTDKSVKNMWLKRIERLKKKQGRMSSRQCKLADKMVSERLKKRLEKVSKFDKDIKKIEKSVENKDKNEESIKKASEFNDKYAQAKDVLKDTGFMGKTVLKGISFAEKLNEKKLEGLKKKQGRLINSNKTLVVKNAQPSFIERMKSKVSFFKNRIAATFDKAVDTYKNYSEPVVAHATR